MIRISEKELNEKYKELICNTLGELKFINYSISLSEPDLNGNIFSDRNNKTKTTLLLSFEDKPFVVRCSIPISDKLSYENFIYREIESCICKAISDDRINDDHMKKHLVNFKYHKEIADIIDFIIEKVKTLESLA